MKQSCVHPIWERYFSNRKPIDSRGTRSTSRNDNDDNVAPMVRWAAVFARGYGARPIRSDRYCSPPYNLHGLMTSITLPGSLRSAFDRSRRPPASATVLIRDSVDFYAPLRLFPRLPLCVSGVLALARTTHLTTQNPQKVRRAPYCRSRADMENHVYTICVWVCRKISSQEQLCYDSVTFLARSMTFAIRRQRILNLEFEAFW